MLGFESVGNATLICHDDKPVLATDPWLSGGAYFGSWVLSHSVPPAQLEHIQACPFLWISHGHPDHLNLTDLESLSGSTILLPDHVGGRIARDLRASGLTVRVLKDAVWERLSPRLRVMSLCDIHQDAALLVDLDGNLLINLNDCSHEAFFWKRLVRKEAQRARRTFLFKIGGYGDSQMINYFDEDGRRTPPETFGLRVGEKLQFFADFYGVDYYVPSSCFHQYQRSDSAWANDYTAPLSAFRDGWSPEHAEMLPANIRFDTAANELTELSVRSWSGELVRPEVFGDSWSDAWEPEDRRLLRDYFQSVVPLWDHLDAVHLRAGGVDLVVEPPRRAKRKKTGREVAFEAPRHSLTEAVRHRVFDDLLIGNFMKTTLHGDWPTKNLVPQINPLLPKYADNGGVRTKEDLENYLATYRRRSPKGWLLHRLEQESQRRLRPVLQENPWIFRGAKKTYHFLHRVIR